MSVARFSLSVLKRLRWFLLAVGIFGSAVAFASGGLFRNGWAGESQSIASSPINEASKKRHALVESEVVTATRRGFEPAAITRPQGQFILVVDNRTGHDLNFRLARDAGELLHEIRSSREQLDWNEVLDLQPGRYVLSELEHPEWTCSITITAP